MKSQPERISAQQSKPAKGASSKQAVEVSLEDFGKRFAAARQTAKTEAKPTTPLQRRMQSGSF
jgi:hypothetical protein